MELELEELEATATEDEIAAELAAAKTTKVTRPSRASVRRASRSLNISPVSAGCRARPDFVRLLRRHASQKTRRDGHRDAGGDPAAVESDPTRPREDDVPGLRKDLRAAGAVPRHAARLGGPNLLAMLLFEKFGQHQPLNRQAERYAREGVPLALSTLADQVGGGMCGLAAAASIASSAHVLAAERLHGDDTTVPVLAKTGKTITGRCWVYVRDDRPFGGTSAAGRDVLLLARPERLNTHEANILARLVRHMLQADAYTGYNKLYVADRTPGANPGGGVLGACAPTVLRARRHRSQRTAQSLGQSPGADLAAGAGRRATHRSAVRDRARHQRAERADERRKPFVRS